MEEEDNPFSVASLSNQNIEARNEQVVQIDSNEKDAVQFEDLD